MIERRTAVITGASRGIGRAIAQELASDCHLALIARGYNELKSVISEISSENRRLYVPFKCDVSSKEEVEATFRKIYQKFGSVDILVNNAGVNSRRTISLKNINKDFAGWNEEILINLTGTYLCSYFGARLMKPDAEGNIINISSIKGKEPTSSPGYGASKAGVIKLTRDFAKALAPKIRVNCIAPGFIDTGMTAELPEEKKREYMKLIPLARFGTLEEIAKVVRFLSSPDASYITGAVIDINGGYLMT